MLTFGGICVLFGASGDATGTVNIRQFFQAGRATLYGFGLFNEFGFTPASASLTRMANLVAAGRLHPRISVTAPWTDIAAVAQRLLDRDYPGKAVLTLVCARAGHTSRGGWRRAGRLTLGRCRP
jgi:NADPH:quinone reductase-like Zn-dependent oxidoreductase